MRAKRWNRLERGRKGDLKRRWMEKRGNTSLKERGNTSLKERGNASLKERGNASLRDSGGEGGKCFNY